MLLLAVVVVATAIIVIGQRRRQRKRCWRPEKKMAASGVASCVKLVKMMHTATAVQLTREYDNADGSRHGVPKLN